MPDVAPGARCWDCGLTTERRSSWTRPDARVVVRAGDGQWEAGVCVWCGAVILSRELEPGEEWEQRAPTAEELERLERAVGPALSAARRNAARLRELGPGEAPMA